jgi:hypothetical protein
MMESLCLALAAKIHALGTQTTKPTTTKNVRGNETTEKH